MILQCQSLLCIVRFPSDDIFESLRHEIVGVRVAAPAKSADKSGESKDAGVPETPASAPSRSPDMEVDGKGGGGIFSTVYAVARL